MGGIASRVRHNRPYYEHLSNQLDRAQRDREKEQPHRCIQERCEKDRNFCVHLMCKYKHTGGRADEPAWMTRFWDFEHQRTETPRDTVGPPGVPRAHPLRRATKQAAADCQQCRAGLYQTDELATGTARSDEEQSLVAYRAHRLHGQCSSGIVMGLSCSACARGLCRL